jgi:next to BRCA1 gene 1 protein
MDDLAFIDDLTIPDNTIVAPESKLDKQWLVQNSGDCNWDARYRLRLISGVALGAVPEQALYPARAGAQVDLRILFTAPQEPGIYISEWQAFDANGIPFGETVFIKIIVQP